MSAVSSGPTMNPTVEPFLQQDAYSGLYDRIRTYICAVVLLPIRVLGAIVIVFLGGLCATIATIGVKDLSQPLALWRRRILYLVKPLARLLLLCFGVWYISEKGKKPNCGIGVPAMTWVANHVSYLDILVFLYLGLPSFVSKRAVASAPGVGRIASALGAVYVERDSTESRSSVLDAIAKRQAALPSGGYPPLLLFPEGTTSNGSCLLQFKRGAFQSGAPVQPVVIRYPYRHFNPAYSTLRFLPHVLRLLTQLSNRVEVVYLPVHQPGAAERADPTLYAAHVQQAMARALHVPVVAQSVADKAACLQRLRGRREKGM